MMRLPEVSFQTSSFGRRLISSPLLLSASSFSFSLLFFSLLSLLSPFSSLSFFSFSSLPSPFLFLKPIYFFLHTLFPPSLLFLLSLFLFLSFPYFICLSLCLLLSVLSPKSTFKALIPFMKALSL